jgi:RNA polymerase sigma-70 factor (ECF subfamily)
MKPKHREVFALFELEGLSGEEISARVGCPVGTVWTRLHHARADFVRIGKKRGYVEPEGGAA